MAHPQGTVTLYRHAQTEWSSVGRFAGRTDLPLTDAGIATVQAYRASREPEVFDEVLVSPLQRAVTTAELLGYSELQLDARLQERDYGDYEGLTTAQIRELQPGWNVWTDPMPGGESMTEFTARIDEIVQYMRERPDARILVVAHAHWIRLFTARWLELPPEQARLFRSDTLGETLLGWERENPVMLAWNR